MAFQHIAYGFESWIEFLWPLLTNLHENAFDAATGSSDAWWRPKVGENFAMGLDGMVKGANVGMFSLCSRGTGKSAQAQGIGAGTGCNGAVSGKTIFGHGEFRDASQTSPQIKVIIDFVENVRWPTSD